MEDPKQQVGSRIRELRLARRMTLSDLARESNVAKATLSNIEAGEANPTLDTLWQLSRALRAPLGSFFGEPRPDLRVVHADEMQAVDGEVLRGRIASMFDVEASRIEVFVGTFLSGRIHRSPAHQHGVVEHILMHRGRLRLGPEGKEIALEPGDYMRMEADRPHSYEALSDDVYFTLIMQYPHELESMRVYGSAHGKLADQASSG
jgi:transcriptional regulator with XRE-family HTH domain